MKRSMYPFSLVLLAVLIISISNSFAAGSGGGGSTKSNSCKDIWSCSEWSSCSKDNLMTRTCELTGACETDATLKPIEQQSCTYVSKLVSRLKCGNLGTSKQRIECRLGLSENDLQKELEIAYLPEECRNGKSQDKEDCVLIYSKSQKCWKLPIGEGRNNCVKEVLGIKDLKEEKNACGTNNGCLAGLKKKAFYMIKFKIYDLEERTEDLMDKGIIIKEQASEVIAKLEDEKTKFNNARTKEDKKKVILEVKKLWTDFINGLKK